MKQLLICILVCTIFLIEQTTSAQTVKLDFEHYNTDNGLPQNSVNYIMQDSHGFIWICTQDGLCRYDGYQFKTFRNDPNSKNTLSNNYVWHIVEDHEGIFWIATFGGGVNRLDPATEVFTHFKWEKEKPESISSNNTFNILDIGEDILIGTNDGFCRMNKKTGTAERYLTTPGNKDDIAGNYVSSLVFYKPGIVWMKSDDGLTQFDIRTGVIRFITAKEITDEEIDLSRLLSIQTFDEDIFLVTRHRILMDSDSNSNFMSLLKQGSLGKFDNFTILGILPSKNGKYWINTNKGLVLFDEQTGNSQYFNYNPSDPNSLANDNVLCTFRSRSGAIWIGSRGGLDKLENEKPKFSLITKQIGNPNTLSHPQISGITQDKYGRVWLGTAGGVNVYDRDNNSFYVFNSSSKKNQQLSADYILDVTSDIEGNIWVGTKAGGLNKIIPDLESKSLENMRVVQYRLNNRSIQSVCPGNGDTLWLGSSGGSLIYFNTSTGDAKTYKWAIDGSGPSHPYVFYVFVDSFKNIWLGTATGGVNLFDPKTSKFIFIKKQEDNPYSLSSNLVLSFFEDKHHQLWVGTTGGLNKLTIPLQEKFYEYFRDSIDVEKDSLFILFNRTNGLPNDLIYGMLEDSHGLLWISTNKGLVKFNPDLKNPVVKTFDISNGLQSNEFNQNAFYKNQNGEMFFGGIGGLNIFYPDSVQDNAYLPPVYITDFKLYNKSVPLSVDPTGEKFQLNRVIERTNKIELAYHHDVITFDFVALNFINPEKNNYKYKLDGFDREWVNAGTVRTATYTNLDPGTYVFKVKASNDDGIWNETGTSLTIEIPPPPWLSWYAYLIYFAVSVFLFYLIVRYRINIATRNAEMEVKLEKARAEAREKFRIRTSQDFHDEAGNRITKINLFVEMASSKKNGNYQKYLKKIAQNTRELSVGMRDFIWALDPEKDTLSDTLLRLGEFGESIFVDAGKEFDIKGLQHEFSNVKLNMDTRRALMLIFKEAMNNCAKYANASKVRLTVMLNSNHLTFELKDNGIGFDQSSPDFKQGYGTKNMISRAESINGKISIHSMLGTGTSVLLELDIPHMGN